MNEIIEMNKNMKNERIISGVFVKYEVIEPASIIGIAYLTGILIIYGKIITASVAGKMMKYAFLLEIFKK